MRRNHLCILILSLACTAQEHGHPRALKSAVEGPASVHNGLAPTACFDPAGRLKVVFAKGDHLYICSSDDLAQSWSEPTVVNRHPLSLALSAENRPSIAIDRSGVLYLAFARALPERFTGQLMFTRSLDGGKNFEPLRQINDDIAITGHAFPAMAVTPAGKVILAWLDGRDHRAQGGDFVGSSIYAARSEDQGASFGPNQRWVAGTCQCCRLALQLDRNQRAVLVWRHIYEGQIRDHGMGREDKSGVFQVSRLTHDQWHIEGCPHQGPALALDAQDRAYAAWFTLKNERATLYFAGVASPEPPRLLDGEAGMHPALRIVGQSVTIVWLHPNDAGTELRRLTSADLGQSFGVVQVLAQTPGPADHPALLEWENKLYVSWQTEGGFHLIPL